MTKLIIFDLDGTLVQHVDGRDKIPSRLSEQEFIPGVLWRCQELREQGYKLSIASNQGGVAFGYCSLEEADARVADAAEQIGASYRFCPYHPKGTVPEFTVPSYDRKPDAGMLFKIMEYYQASPAETLFVGDMDTDREAAKRAGVRFEWAKDFFGWEGEE